MEWVQALLPLLSGVAGVALGGWLNRRKVAGETERTWQDAYAELRGLYLNLSAEVDDLKMHVDELYRAIRMEPADIADRILKRIRVRGGREDKKDAN